MSATGGSEGLHSQVESRANRVDQAITNAVRITMEQGEPVTFVAIAGRAGASPIVVCRRNDELAKIEYVRNGNALVDASMSETPLPEGERRTHPPRVIESPIGPGCESTGQPADSDGQS